ncbi:MAG: hypothetical protein LBI17_03525 [Rickettsiales bacterium]|jgi:hypothetical protein|nr:hypothetical protein [Rickettsiales bacterium]
MMNRIYIGIEELLFSDTATRKKLSSISRQLRKTRRKWERQEYVLAYGCDGKDERRTGRFLEKLYYLNALNCTILNDLHEFYDILSLNVRDEGKESMFITILDGSDFANRYFQAMYDRAVLMSSVKCLDNGKRPEAVKLMDSMWNILGMTIINSIVGREGSIMETFMDLYGKPIADALGYLIEEGFESDNIIARLNGSTKWAICQSGISMGGGMIEEVSYSMRDLVTEFTANVKAGNYIPPEEAVMHEMRETVPATKVEILQFTGDAKGKVVPFDIRGRSERG